MECPNCHSADDNRVIHSPRNLKAALANAFYGSFWLNLWPFVPWKRVTTPAYPLRRKCRACGFKFLGEVPERPNFDECPRCGYDLTGNESGRCPECGWKLTLRYRVFRRRANRSLRLDSTGCGYAEPGETHQDARREDGGGNQ